MAANHQCIGNCRMCTVLGACPADTLTCEDCGESKRMNAADAVQR